MHPSVAPLAAIFDLNTDLLINCLDGLSDEDARRRMAGGGNSVTFLAAHLIDTRHFLTARLGRPLANPLAPLLAQAKSIDDIQAWPSLERLRAGWITIAEHLGTALEGLSSDELAKENVHRFPLSDSTALGFLAFLAQHDSYHVGQVAFLRRQLGLEAMAYTRGPGRRAAPPAV